MDELVWIKYFGGLCKHIAEWNASVVQGFSGQSPEPAPG
jgi:hypothetical protein